MLKDLDQYDLDLPVETDHRTRRKDRSGELLRMGLARLTNDYKPLSVLLTGQGVEKIIRLQGLRESSQLELYDPDPPSMLSAELKKVLKQGDCPAITKMTLSYDEPGFIFWIRQAASTIRELTIQCGHKLFMQPYRRKSLLNTFFSTAFPRLKALTLCGTQMTGIDLFNFVRHSGNFPVLKNLDLSSNNLNSIWFNAFVQSSFLKQLKRLDLSDNQISSRYLAYLIRHGELRNLKYLSLKDTGTTAKQILNPNGHGGGVQSESTCTTCRKNIGIGVIIIQCNRIMILEAHCSQPAI
ncbi:MAG: leucine-rich repeat domain-containing protein [Candidatus Paracaedibacteraceae bacterium]|nr:leucine-rich repeat domain-containing protein [Candidatus Paracaedibacteraceae bacterium]